MQEDRIKRLEEFVGWFNDHITGYEKGEGQIFFNRLVQAFGNAGILEIGASCEERVKKRKGSTGFVDFIWQPRVVIELKERGTHLEKHFSQIFEYWWSLRPHQPQFMVLCNFDEFWIYELNKQDEPVHKLKTKDLASQWSALAFLFPKSERPVFNNDNEEVTIKAAQTIGSMFVSMTKRKIEPAVAQKFVLQIVVSLFAEDVNLIPKNTIYKILEDAVQKDIKTQKEMTDLFIAMSNKDINKKPKKYKDIPYFNGGIFEDVETVELNFKELDLLFDAAKKDWSKVRPSIFGSIFESSMDQNKRHDLGAHFTSEGDIQKIVYPTIVMPIRKKIDAAKTKPALTKVLEEIRKFKVLDPACGSGNFLYIAFKELRRLEVEVMELLAEKTGSKQISFSMISPKNFYGIDVNGFGIELAKVALCIGRKLSADEFKVQDTVLPFENLDDHFFKTDALFTKWPDVDAIIGNPPFLGGKYLRRDRGEEYAEKIYSAFPDVKGQPDFCVFWFRKAQDAKAIKVGLVGTNSISQGQSREASLEYIVQKKSEINYAISTQVWSGDANVHVSIVCWSKNKTDFPKILDGKEVPFINSSLKNEIDVTKAFRLQQNLNLSFQGCELSGKAFVITKEQAKEWINKRKENAKVLKKMIDGKSLVNPNSEQEWVIDFNQMTIEEASRFVEPFEHVKLNVKPERDSNKRAARKKYWWRFGETRPGMRTALIKKNNYFCLPKIAKFTNFRSIDISTLPCEANMVVASDDFYILGILNSKLHLDWVKAQCSTLEDRIRYTNTNCFETFPFLWNEKSKKVDSIRTIATELENHRVSESMKRKISITQFYNQFINEPTSELHKLHEQLNRACSELYGWKYDSNRNYNEELFKLNQEMYKKEAGKQSSFLEEDAKTNSESLKSKKPTKKAKKK